VKESRDIKMKLEEWKNKNPIYFPIIKYTSLFGIVIFAMTLDVVAEMILFYVLVIFFDK